MKSDSIGEVEVFEPGEKTMIWDSTGLTEPVFRTIQMSEDEYLDNPRSVLCSLQRGTRLEVVGYGGRVLLVVDRQACGLIWPYNPTLC